MKLLVLLVFVAFAAVEAFTPVSQASMAHTRYYAVTQTTRMQANKESNDFSTRRSWLSNAGLATSVLLTPSFFPGMAHAATKTTTELYQDTTLGFEIKVPSGWEKQVQTLADRRKIILYIDPTSNEQSKPLLFFAFTPVRDDFTSLSSFGSVDDVGEATILPKGSLAGEDNESKMLKAESKKSAYFFDYEAKTPGQPLTHFRTIFSLASVPGAAGATLVTLTAQAPESEYGKLKPLFDEIMDSYGKIK